LITTDQEPSWPALATEEWHAMKVHVHTSDFPETNSDWYAPGREAGFHQVTELFVTPYANKAVLRVLPFTSKRLNGKTYLVTQAEVSVETDFGTPRKGVGLIFDKENGREYALAIEDFYRFIETGDVCLLPREFKPSSGERVVRLKELCTRADG
jgi:hypothetical protein